jgi:AraC-like DNA-binding protein
MLGTAFDTDLHGRAGHVFAHDRPAQASVRQAVAQLGHLADRTVLPGQLKFFAERLGWPEWLFDGTSHQGLAKGEFPRRLTVRDDLLLAANIVDAGAANHVIAFLDAEERLPDSPSVALALLAEPTLGLSLKKLGHLLGEQNPYIDFQFSEEADLIRLAVDYCTPLGEVADFISAIALVVLRQAVRSIAPSAILHLRLEIMPSMESLMMYNSALLDCGDMMLTSGPAAITLPVLWNDYRNSVHNPALRPLIEAAIEKTVASMAADQSVTELVRARIVTTFDQGRSVLRLKQITTEMAMPMRTIVRRLHNEGSSFHDLLESERKRRAGTLIADQQIALKVIAEQLGFPDVSSFGRAFKRWYGTSPGRYRASMDKT